MSSRRDRQAVSRVRLVRRRECGEEGVGAVVGAVWSEEVVGSEGEGVGSCEAVVVVVVGEVWEVGGGGGWLMVRGSCFRGDLKGLWRAEAGSSRRRRLSSGVDIV